MVDIGSESVGPVVVNDDTSETIPRVVESVSENVSENADEEGMSDIDSLDDNLVMIVFRMTVMKVVNSSLIVVVKEETISESREAVPPEVGSGENRDGCVSFVELTLMLESPVEVKAAGEAGVGAVKSGLMLKDVDVLVSAFSVKEDELATVFGMLEVLPFVEMSLVLGSVVEPERLVSVPNKDFDGETVESPGASVSCTAVADVPVLEFLEVVEESN